MTEENKRALKAMGGVFELARRLNVNVKRGLTSEEAAGNFQARRSAFGDNVMPEPPSKGFWQLWVESFNDLTLIILIIAAIVSLIIGAIEDPEKGWLDGIAILIAVLIVAFVTAANDYSKEKQFRALNAVKDAIIIKTIRDGQRTNVPVQELQVGDVLDFEEGDKIAADCIFINGDDVESNESSLTGEPEDIKKNAERDPFLLSGCQITAGKCRALVIAVGDSSRWGRIKARLATEPEDTPLQEKLDDMAKFIGKIGSGAGLATMVMMIIMWYANPEAVQEQARDLTDWIIHAFIVCITIIVVAVPEGLPLAVTISLAYSTRKMLSDNNFIRVLAACETMGNATNICSDKTGTLTENRMTVVAGWLCGKVVEQKDTAALADPKSLGLSDQFVETMKEGMAINSTATVGLDKEGRIEVTGSKTEGALLLLIEKWGADYLSIRAATTIKKQYLFTSARKMMSTLVARPDGTYRLYVKGAAEIVVGRSTRFLEPSGEVIDFDDGKRQSANEHIIDMAKQALRTIAVGYRDYSPEDLPDTWEAEAPEEGLTLEAIVGIMDPLRDDVHESVRTCQRAGIMVRMVTGDNIETAKAIAKQCSILTDKGEALEGPNFREMTPAGLDTFLPRLQVLARSSPDDKHTLVVRLNGQKLPKDEAAWRAMHPGQDYETMKDNLLPGYRAEWLQTRKGAASDGEVVGVTGDGTNDAPALKAADVGLSMGKSGTEVAKEASDIVILDDRFSSIVKAVLWGRSVYDNIRKFLQFQLTVNVVALALTFLAAMLSYDPPLNPVMMLWVNLIMDTMGALALGTEAPTMDLLNRKPYRRTAPLLNYTMIRNILVQSLYQLVVLMVMLLQGGTTHADDGSVEREGFLGVHVIDGLERPCINGRVEFDEDGRKVCPDGNDYTHFTIIFNTFVWCQIFNEFNARRINNDFNVFKGLSTNPMFIFVIFASIGLQVVMVEVGGDFVKTVGLSLDHWGLSIAYAAITMPLGFLMRFIPITDDPSDFGGYDDPLSNSSGHSVDVADKKQVQVEPVTTAGAAEEKAT